MLRQPTQLASIQTDDSQEGAKGMRVKTKVKAGEDSGPGMDPNGGPRS